MEFLFKPKFFGFWFLTLQTFAYYVCVSEGDQGKQSVCFSIVHSTETCKESIPLYVGNAGLCRDVGMNLLLLKPEADAAI